MDIEKAYKDAKAAIIPFQAGYFYIVDHVGPASGMFESNGTLHFNKGAWTQPEHPAAKDMAYIWKLVPKDETPNLFYLQNFVTGNYAGFVNGYSIVIPTTSEKTQAYMISNFPGVKGYFGIQVNGSEMYLHANTSGANTVVYWDTSHQNSAWKLHAIPQADIDALQTELQQQKNNKQFSNLFEEADAYYKKGLAYKSDATPGDYPATVDGLLTHVQQLSTNAQEPTEGKIGNLIDGNLKTYFHTTWSVANPDVEYHCLNVDLEKAVSAVTMKYAKRFNSHSNGLPSKVHIFTSNDSVNWVSQGIVKFAFTDSATIDGSKVANFIGRTSAAFKNGEKYRYLRLQVEQNQGGSRTNGNLYFFLGELRIYEAAYDKDNSLAESVDPTIRKNLVDQLEAAPAVIAAGNATQDNINALQTALEAYKAVYPDPATLQAEIQRQQQLIDVAVEGEGFGNYDNGAKASFQTALDAVKNHINEFRTIEQLNTAKAQVAEAAKTFAAALHKPATGDIIYLRCKSDNATLNKQYVYAAANNTKITLRWGWYSADDGEDANLSNLLTLMWMVKANDDGTFTLKNVGTGLNMAARTEKATNTDNDLRLAAAGSETPVSVSFEAAPVASSFLLSVGKGTYLRFYTKAGLVYTDNAPSADSYFTIEKAVAWGENTYVGFTAQRPTPCTLPYDIESSIGDEGTLYQVKGLYTEGDKKTLELTAFAPNTIIHAGTPFIVVANEGHDGVNFFPTASSLYEFTYSFDCAKVNGLCGTLDRQEMKAGQGIFNKGKVVSATNEDAIGGNSAYLDHTVPVITEKGDYSVPVEGFDVTGISPSVTVTAHDAIYDLHGRRVVKTQRGLYIINGKKVVVK